MGRSLQKWKNCAIRTLTVLVLYSSNLLASKQARLYRVSPTNATSRYAVSMSIADFLHW